MLVVVVYVDDIIFSSGSNSLTCQFAAHMKAKFEMSMLGKLSYFLGLWIAQSSKVIFISQRNYFKEVLKKFGIEECWVSTPMVTRCKIKTLVI